MRTSPATRHVPDRTFAALPTGYRALCCDVLLPRPLRSRAEYRAAVAVADMMAGHDLTRDQDDYLDALSTFIEAFEAAHEPRMPPVSPVELLRHLLAENNLTGADLARLLQITRSLASRLLSAERQLTARHIAVLSTRFRLDPRAFLPTVGSK
jgi:HTH-type transcriptional regulator / antitoxin HigA